MRPEAATDEGLARIWKHDIMPLLEEHYYGRLTRAQIHERFGLASLHSTLAPTGDALISPTSPESEPEAGEPETPLQRRRPDCGPPGRHQRAMTHDADRLDELDRTGARLRSTTTRRRPCRHRPGRGAAGPDGWRLAPAGRVGSVRIGGLQVQVRPKDKVGLTRLLFLLGYARDPGFREEGRGRPRRRPVAGAWPSPWSG